MADLSRRFLTAAGLGLVGTARAQEAPKIELPPVEQPGGADQPIPNPDPVGRRLGVAVVGIGHLSLEQILPGFGQARHVKLAALVSGDPAKARTVAAQYGVPDTHVYDYAGFDRLRDNADVDIVYIVLPNAMHAEYTVRAAQAGKHVLCEKPMATSVADAEHMVASCKAAGRKLMIAYRMQYNPFHRFLIGAVRDKSYGNLRAIFAANGQNQVKSPPQWRHDLRMAGGGSLVDVGIYCFNAARYITGEEPVAVQASLTRPTDDPRFKQVEDVCNFTLRFPSGVVAQMQSGYSHHETRLLHVMTENATISMDPAFAYQGLRMTVARKDGNSASTDARRFPERNQFATEMDAFAEAIRANKEPLTPGEEGTQDMRVIAAIYQAAEGGGTVKLPEVKGLDTTRGPAPTQS